MELAMASRVLPSLPQSRLLTPKPILTSSLRFRAKRGLVLSNSRSKSGSDFWSTAGEETTRLAVADKSDEVPLEKEEEVSVVEEVKEEVSVVDEVTEEVPDAAEVKEELVTSEVVSEDQSPASDFLDQLDLNLDSDDKSKLLVYGVGALAALWISSVVVSAVDSIPLFPKLMEVVGLGYTVWFTSRYLLFKDNREELFAKIIELKDQVLGSDDE